MNDSEMVDEMFGFMDTSNDIGEGMGPNAFQVLAAHYLTLSRFSQKCELYLFSTLLMLPPFWVTLYTAPVLAQRNIALG